MPQNDYRQMPKTSIKNYQHILKRLHEHYGSKAKTCEAIGICVDSFNRLINDGEVSLCIVRKIMEGFTAINSDKPPKKIYNRRITDLKFDGELLPEFR